MKKTYRAGAHAWHAKDLGTPFGPPRTAGVETSGPQPLFPSNTLGYTVKLSITGEVSHILNIAHFLSNKEENLRTRFPLSTGKLLAFTELIF